MIRVCPDRDAVCPWGMRCPYVLDRYTCKPGNHMRPGEKPMLLSQEERGQPTSVEGER